MVSVLKPQEPRAASSFFFTRMCEFVEERGLTYEYWDPN